MKTTIFSIWLLLGVGYWYIANNYCDANSSTTEIVEVTSPFYFENGASDIIPTESFKKYKEDLLNLHPKDAELTIIGYMTPDEQLTNENIGLERAQALMNHLNLSDDKVTLRGEVVENLSPNSQYASINNPADENIVAAETNSSSNTRNDRTIVENELGDGTYSNIAKHSTIYFPFNSTQKLERQEVNSYLNSIALRVLGSGETIVLTGYADHIGTRAYNYRLGEKRAYAIKYYLISRGVNPRKILTVSKGEGYNRKEASTEDRQDDRRVELLLLN